MDEIRHVAAFVAIAELLHIGRASEALGLSRRTAADRLRAIERRLGMCLVDRRHRCRIALTPEGAAVLPAARAVLAAHEALDAAAAEVREGRRGVVRVAVVDGPGDLRPGSGRPDDARPGLGGPGAPPPRGPADHPGGVGDEGVRALGPAGEALADVLGRIGDGWRVEYLPMDRWSARRAMAVGGLECAIGIGRPLRIGPGALDPRPHRRERTASAVVDDGRGLPTAVTWRSAWAPGRSPGDDAETGDDDAESVGDRVVEHVRWLARQARDVRYPRRAAARRAVAERRRAAHARIDRLDEDTRRLGREAALRRTAEEERREAIERYEAASASGDVTLHVLVDWLCATRGRGDRPPDADPAPA
ncbi:helix-turn-helix domain-containing protein [Patulibacter minatonensis]|uniref:helix-turn-helix domain-containing protein n=1 Tax=Patulibacter minatonensis TaxID=298163 RepID=UPI00047A2377|nr:LysR family transcriptional regulator [Patulibacter minatonensis]